jgi:hypothetical protein
VRTALAWSLNLLEMGMTLEATMNPTAASTRWAREGNCENSGVVREKMIPYPMLPGYYLRHVSSTRSLVVHESVLDISATNIEVHHSPKNNYVVGASPMKQDNHLVHEIGPADIQTDAMLECLAE